MLVTAKVEKDTNLLFWMSQMLFNTKVHLYNHIDNRNFYFLSNHNNDNNNNS